MKRSRPSASAVAEARFAEFQDLLAKGAPFSALQCLGEVQLLLGLMRPDERAHWEHVLDGVAVPDAVAWSECPDMMNDVARIQRLSESDRNLQFEEYCLVLSSRWGIRCALAFLKRINPSTTDDVLRRVDRLILEMAKDDKTRQTLGRAAAFAAKNMGLPLGASALLPVAWAH